MTTSNWRKTALVLFGLILSLVLLEAGMRLGGFILLSVQEYRNLQSIKQKNAYRILCLGESTTQEQYPLLLEQILNRRNTGMRFSVIDEGRAATNTSTILKNVEAYLAEYHPNIVIAMMGINDAGNHIPFEIATTSKVTLFIRSFRIYKLARLLWLHLLTKTVKIEPALTEDFLKKTIELNPKDDNAYFELGCLYHDQDKYPQAEEALKKSLDLNPKNDNALARLGRLYRNRNKFPQAEDVLKKALELNPKNYTAYYECGWLYREQGKFSPAGDMLKKAIELRPENHAVYVELGWLYLDQGKFSQAENSFKKAIELNPEDHCLYNAISVLYEKINKPELAEEHSRKADGLKFWYLNPVTVDNYQKLKEILDKKGIKLVCVQYPMRNVKPLKKIFENDEGVIFVDSERVFKEALKKESYKEYFTDMFGGDFGHCTQKGNELLAQNIAAVILKEAFNKERDQYHKN